MNARSGSGVRSVVLIMAAVVGCAAVSSCTWLKSLGKSDNVEPPTPLTEITPSLAVTKLWDTGIGKGSGASGARMRPAVANGRVYVASVDGKIAALDAATGKRIWSKDEGSRAGLPWRRHNTGMRWSGGPGVDGDLVVVGGLDGHVQAYAAADGSKRWSATVASEVIAPPAIGEGVVVVRCDNGRLYGFDATDGSRRWVVDQSVPLLSLRGDSAPVIAHGALIVGFANGKVIAYNLADGSLLWTQTVATGEGRTEVDRLADVDGTVVVDGTDVFAAGYNGQLAAISGAEGRQLWQRDLSSYAGVAVNSTAVVVVASDGEVWAFDRSTGANLWKQDKLKYRWLSSPAIIGNAVVVGDLEGYLHWLSLDEGKIVARERISSKPIEGAPVVVDNTVYVEDVNGNVAAWRVGP